MRRKLPKPQRPTPRKRIARRRQFATSHRSARRPPRVHKASRSVAQRFTTRRVRFPLEHATQGSNLFGARTSEPTTKNTPARPRRGSSRSRRRTSRLGRRCVVPCGSNPRHMRLRRRRVFGGFFEEGLDPTSRRIPPLGPAGPRTRGDRRKAIVERQQKHRKTGLFTRLAFSSCCMGNHAPREPGVRQRPAFHGLPSGKRWLCRAPARQGWARTMLSMGSCPRSKLRQKSNENVAPRRATPRETRALHRPAR
jgi:hypothetical protein